MIRTAPHLSVVLVGASAAIVLLLGLAHVLMTFFGRAFHLRDAALEEKLHTATIVLTRETTLWRCWIGFNASHSLGAIVFGLAYGYLALAQRGLLFGSVFLPTLGFATLLAYLWLAWFYWFSRPLRGIVLATACYLAGFLLAWL